MERETRGERLGWTFFVPRLEECFRLAVGAYLTAAPGSGPPRAAGLGPCGGRRRPGRCRVPGLDL